MSAHNQEKLKHPLIRKMSAMPQSLLPVQTPYTIRKSLVYLKQKVWAFTALDSLPPDCGRLL